MNKAFIGHGYQSSAVSTIQQFCADHHISRTHFYELLKAGKGPRLMKPGRRVLITAEAAADWRRAMEDEAKAKAAVEPSVFFFSV